MAGVIYNRAAVSGHRRAVLEATDVARRGWGERPMRWGIDDCALAVANIYRTALPVDPARAFRGRYRSPGGARRVLGNGGLIAALRAAARGAGWRPVAPAAAEVGDLGMVMTPEGPACVIRHLAHWLGRNTDGFTAVPTAAVRRAWSIGQKEAS